jgi:hypothetical protein
VGVVAVDADAEWTQRLAVFGGTDLWNAMCGQQQQQTLMSPQLHRPLVLCVHRPGHSPPGASCVIAAATVEAAALFLCWQRCQCCRGTQGQMAARSQSPASSPGCQQSLQCCPHPTRPLQRCCLRPRHSDRDRRRPPPQMIGESSLHPIALFTDVTRLLCPCVFRACRQRCGHVDAPGLSAVVMDRCTCDILTNTLFILCRLAEIKIFPSSDIPTDTPNPPTAYSRHVRYACVTTLFCKKRSPPRIGLASSARFACASLD